MIAAPAVAEGATEACEVRGPRRLVGAMSPDLNETTGGLGQPRGTGRSEERRSGDLCDMLSPRGPQMSHTSAPVTLSGGGRATGRDRRVGKRQNKTLPAGICSVAQARPGPRSEKSSHRWGASARLFGPFGRFKAGSGRRDGTFHLRTVLNCIQLHRCNWTRPRSDRARAIMTPLLHTYPSRNCLDDGPLGRASGKISNLGIFTHVVGGARRGVPQGTPTPGADCRPVQLAGLFGATNERSVCTDTPISAAASLANWSSSPARSRVTRNRRPPSLV